MLKTLLKYRGPLVTGVVLFLASCTWAWLYWGTILDRERHQDLRLAVSLAAVLGPILDHQVNPANDDEALKRLIEERLRVKPPLIYAIVLRGEHSIATVGGIPREVVDPLAPGPIPDEDLQVLRIPIGREPPPEPSGRSAPPPGPPPGPPRGPPLISWEWRNDGPPPPASLVVGISTKLAPHVIKKTIPEIAFALAVGWAGIIALVLAWYRSIRSRDLARALEVERRERARLEEMNLVAAGLAHETKNPLGIILGLAQRIERDSGAAPEIQEAAEHIIDAADRATARISDFLHFARVPVPKLEATPTEPLIARIVTALMSDFDEAGVRIVTQVPPLSIECAPEMMEQVIVNLLLNCLQASKPDSTVSLSLEPHGTTAELIVADQGRGISPTLLPNLFKPYVTGHADGHGLGLAIVKRIVDQHGWTIRMDSMINIGTRVFISGISISSGQEQKI